jgi:hypothetical protein
METYVLIVLVALFLGVMGIIAMMERRRRTELAQADQLHQTLTACVGWLQAIHSSDEAQMAKVAEALSQLRNAVEEGAVRSSKSAATLSSDTVRAIEQTTIRLESAVQQHQKALDTTLIRAADKLSESSGARTKEMISEAQKLLESSKARTQELLSESQRTTKAVQELQASLEASAKF